MRQYSDLKNPRIDSAPFTKSLISADRSRPRPKGAILLHRNQIIPSSTSQKKETIGYYGAKPKAERRFDSGLILAFCLVALSFLAALYISSRRLFWYDEIITLQIATLPTAKLLVQALAHASDTMTPAYMFVTRAFVSVFHTPEFGARLPSAIAVGIGSLVVFYTARRLTNTCGGLLALAVLMNSFLTPYAYEARAYAIFFLCSSLALWVWLFAPPKRSALWFGTCFFAGELLHHYFVFCIVPYACSELYWMFHQRRLTGPSVKLSSGLAATLVAILIDWPFVHAIGQLAKGFWAVPWFSVLTQAYSDYVPNLGLLLGIAAMWLTLFRQGKHAEVPPAVSEPERLGWLFLTIPVAGFVMARLITNAFYPRYFMGLLPGVALAIACLGYRMLAPRTLAFAGVTGLALILSIISEIQAIKTPELIDFRDQRVKTRRVLAAESSVAKDGKKYLVPCDPLLFSELAYYCARSRSVWLLADLDTSPERSSVVRVMKNFDPFLRQQLWDLRDLKAHASESALVAPGEELTRYLLANGYHMTVKLGPPVPIVYLSR